MSPLEISVYVFQPLPDSPALRLCSYTHATAVWEAAGGPKLGLEFPEQKKYDATVHWYCAWCGDRGGPLGRCQICAHPDSEQCPEYNFWATVEGSICAVDLAAVVHEMLGQEPDPAKAKELEEMLYATATDLAARIDGSGELIAEAAREDVLSRWRP